MTGISYQKLTGRTIVNTDDYRKFIATKTTGLTKIGQKLFQQSVESYVYAILEAQAKARWAIVGSGAKSLQTQDVFLGIIKNTIAQSDMIVTISDMRESISDTNVVLNMAISPGMILIPSDLIIQKERTPGYNNILTLATEDMKFGKNDDVSYKERDSHPSQGPNETLPCPSQTNELFTQTTRPGKTPGHIQTMRSMPTNKGSELLPLRLNKSFTPATEILSTVMLVSGFLISKYII